MNSLRVSMQGKEVGKLSIDENEVYHFEYDKSWIEKGFAIRVSKRHLLSIPTKRKNQKEDRFDYFRLTLYNM
jgi:HipA-like protein